MRMHDEIMQPVYCRQDTLTGVMELCDSMLWCFHHLVQFVSTEKRTHDETMPPAYCWHDTLTGVTTGLWCL